MQYFEHDGVIDICLHDHEVLRVVDRAQRRSGVVLFLVGCLR